MAKDQTVIYIEVYGGCVLGVYGLPKTWAFELIDWDHEERDGKNEALKQKALAAEGL